MKHRFLKYGATALMSGVVMSTLFISSAFAVDPCTKQGQVFDPTSGGCTNITPGGLSVGSANELIANIINVVLGLLGLISLIIFLVAGFQWMTSGGDDKKIEGAKKLMKSAIIGIVIVLVAYVASNFVMQTIFRATGTVK